MSEFPDRNSLQDSLMAGIYACDGVAPDCVQHQSVWVSRVLCSISREVPRLREKLTKIGAKVDRPGHYVTFQMAEVAVPQKLFGEIPRLNDGLRPKPAPA
jgi:hypothetical protein